jgi:Reverse transcriptase (RNA-dependent DNA polymerase)/RNase H-like domain found in reverse transcriptase
LIEGSLETPCRALMVARTLVRAPSDCYPCRVMNPTSRTISLAKGTTIGTIAPVTPELQSPISKQTSGKAGLSIEQQRNALEEKEISLTDTALVGKDLDSLIELLYRNIDIMATTVAELPGTNVMLHRINTGTNPPVRKRAYRHSPADKAEISRQTQEMLDAGIIEESDTPWCSPVLLVTKKDGSKRFVVDFRGVNAATALTSWPLPTLDEVLDVVADQKPTLWTSLDLRSGYWHTGLDPETADRTGFQTHDGKFVFKRLPFGLCGAPGFFQMVMQKVLRELTSTAVLIYLDDILVMGKTPTDMFQKLDEVFQRFRSANLRIHPAKCHWAVSKVKFLGHVFDERGISVDESKFSFIKHVPVPDTARKVRSFLGLGNYYRRFVKGFSQISAPLRQLLKTNVPFQWNKDYQHAFEQLKTALITAPILSLPDFSRGFVMTTDASYRGIGYILGQRDDNGRE